MLAALALLPNLDRAILPWDTLPPSLLVGTTTPGLYDS